MTAFPRIVVASALGLLLATDLFATTARTAVLPLSFEANDGQTAPGFHFLAHGQGFNLFFAPGEVVMRPSALSQRADVLRMRFSGASECVRLSGLDPLPWKSNYFIGNEPEHWHRDVPNFGKVKYEDLYPGIDLIYYGNGRRLEYDIVVAPGADPDRVVLTFEGATGLSIAADGNLMIGTASGTLVQQKPVVYQSAGARRELVDGRYVLLGDQRVGFVLGGYDTARPVVIDPVLVYSTWVGGSGNDVGRAIAVDFAGSAYITGETASVDFPLTASSAIQPLHSGGSYDVFVAKLNTSGTALMYATYLGGSNGDFGYAIAVDAAGNAYVTGDTSSTTAAGQVPFPLVGPIQATYGLGGDAFIAKINPAGNTLLYSTYYGGTGGERGYGIAVDSAGSAYITGSTNSTNLPVVGAMQDNGGNYDAFVAKLSASGSVLIYSTYLGGSGSEFSVGGGGIAVDPDGNAYVVGTTGSLNFPGVGAGSIQPVYGGDFNDGFVAKVNATGSALIYSTYLGGSARESAHDVALDSANNAYVTGMTNSPNFPTVTPLQAARNGPGDDVFVSKINAAGNALVYSTYLGGSTAEIGYAIKVDRAGNAHIAGWTDSLDFPTVAPMQVSSGGIGDMFLSAINPAGSALLFSSYFGGSGNEFGYGLALDGAEKRYATGYTNSANFPSAGPLQGYAGLTDAFVVAFTGPGPAAPTGLVATASTATTVDISWNASAGATQYELARTSGAGYAALVNVAGTSYTDTSTISGKTYVYMVRAIDALSQSSPFSARDAATTIFFSDDPLEAGLTTVRATHVQQLRQATNAMRTTAGLATLFTDPNLIGQPIRANHVIDIRLLLTEARSTLGLSASPAYTDTLAAGTTVVKAAHVQELRTVVK